MYKAIYQPSFAPKAGLGAIYHQYFPPKPTFTEEDVPPGSQVGRVFIVTGANQGIGYELVKMLYPTGATIYLAGRSQERIETAMGHIAEAHEPAPSTPANLKYLHLDLSDLSTIKASAASFIAQEKRLDILWNNAGIGAVPEATTKQNIEGHIGINCVAPLLFTQELLPLLKEATKTAPSGSVRVVWTSSLVSETMSRPGGLDFDFIENSVTVDPLADYAASKVGNFYLAVEAVNRWGRDGIVSVCQNPGNLDTHIYSVIPKFLQMVLKTLILYPPRLGGLTMLYSGFTPDVTLEKNNGAYIRPWGYVAPNGRQDVYENIAMGKPAEFWEWCERKCQPYV